MYKNTAQRTNLSELMDNPNVEKQALLKAYKDINHVNTFLGGNNITLDGILNLEKYTHSKTPLRITDIGCGDGETLKKCAQYAQKNHKNWKLAGVDINSNTILLAKKNTVSFPQISFIEADVFSEAFAEVETDIFVFSLTLHHFKDNEIMTILEKAIRQAKVGVVINDLRRSNIAYRLFQLYSFLFFKSAIAKHDGLVSILRGFKKHELKQFATQFAQANHSIKYKWAFRWQWIIKKYEC
ncbi:MAG: methyltransferase domain-containing protein [Flavobacteriaceae bacterium]|nr:methyltransferase domain-containing protein [Flavobacteriaceae bacterium]